MSQWRVGSDCLCSRTPTLWGTSTAGPIRTREALPPSLRITLAEAIEMNRQEARQAAGEGCEEVRITG